MTSDTIPITPLDLDLALSTAEVEQAASLLSAARHRLDRYPACQSITPALDALIVGCEAVVGAMDKGGTT